MDFSFEIRVLTKSVTSLLENFFVRLCLQTLKIIVLWYQTKTMGVKNSLLLIIYSPQLRVKIELLTSNFREVNK